ncbi:MAG: hypothetical protein RMJ00_06295 [Nitrososphaerota archaeon]|nr:hypothetical protein [Nitrososphaerota archaeon]
MGYIAYNQTQSYIDRMLTTTVSLFAASSCYFSTFVRSIGSIKHCDCNYILGIKTKDVQGSRAYIRL